MFVPSQTTLNAAFLLFLIDHWISGYTFRAQKTTIYIGLQTKVVLDGSWTSVVWLIAELAKLKVTWKILCCTCKPMSSWFQSVGNCGTEDLRSGLNLSLDDSTQVISEATHHGSFFGSHGCFMSSPVASLPPNWTPVVARQALADLGLSGQQAGGKSMSFHGRIHWASQDPPVLLYRGFFLFRFRELWMFGFYRTSKSTTWKSWLSLFFMEGSGNIRVIAGNPWHTVCCIYMLNVHIYIYTHTIQYIIYSNRPETFSRLVHLSIDQKMPGLPQCQDASSGITFWDFL